MKRPRERRRAPANQAEASDPVIAIGAAAARAGVKASALRFYEEEDLIRSIRGAGGRRHYPRSELRRIAFIRAGQAVGLTLKEIKAALASLPCDRTPTKEDWARLSRGWRDLLDERLASLAALRDTLASCIGCGCLSLKVCALYNPQDVARRLGSGPRYLMGDTSSDALKG
jgi:MerR family redox-sensitive transcriptional activator SoxR